jgi:hypothetical protein
MEKAILGLLPLERHPKMLPLLGRRNRRIERRQAFSTVC